MHLNPDQARVAVIGLGYVGLPLAIEMATRYPTVGFDIDTQRVSDLRRRRDVTLEATEADFARARHLTVTDDTAALASCNTYIVTVPTPIDAHKQPDCRALIAASRTVGSVLTPGDVVIYESTVFPGATEEICVPELEAASGLTFNTDFYAGYSPERINPGDKVHRLPDIIKVTSGSTPEVADYVDALYAAIVKAGTHKVTSIRVAEAAKVIENTQRDLNIALINELAMIFERLGLDSEEVLLAAGTKWNFLPFRPGLVGGHCIGVDPYYLTHKAQAIGYHPEMILAGRRINDQMGEHIADRVLRLMARKGINPVGAKVLVLGLAFKENCPDIRNTKVVDMVRALQSYHLQVDVHDPWIDPDEAVRQYGISLVQGQPEQQYDAIIAAVGHEQFRSMTADDLAGLCKAQRIIFDVKHILPRNEVDGRL